MKPTLHALIIGINTYDENVRINGQYLFRSLQGCVRDAQALHEWLKQDDSFELKATTLYDNNATKANIVKAFEEELTKAQPGDSILIFYSGHGAVEEADQAVWTDESDGRLEGLVCYYQQGDSGTFVLADKELRYLINRISKPGVHVAALFDSCHSGDSTRAALNDDLVKKQAFVTFKQRNWDDFIFSGELKPADFAGKKVEEIIPEGRHVQLAAAESNESAIEATIGSFRHGVFGYHLLEILRETQGHISYADLCNRIRNRIRYRFGQRIKIYTPREYMDLQDSGFLQKGLPDVSMSFGAVDYNEENDEYRLNRGILNRVVSGKTRVKVTGSSGEPLEGVVRQADLTTSEVMFDGTTKSKLARNSMQAAIEGLAGRALRVCMVSKDLLPGEGEALQKTLFNMENQDFILEESEPMKADYLLVAGAGMYYLTKPQDGLFQPVTMPVYADEKTAAQDILKQLKQIAQWHFTLELKNETGTAIPTGLIQLEFTDDKGIAIPLQGEVLPVDPPRTGTTAAGTPVFRRPTRLRITNTSTQDLYVAPLLLMDYGCLATLITNPDGNRPIEPGHSEELEINLGVKTPYMPLGLDQTTRLFNRPFSSSTLKFIISTEPITGIASLDLKALPTMDDFMSKTRSADQSKGNWDTSDQSQTLPIGGWNALNIEIRVNNPLYNRVNMEEINQYVDPNSAKVNPYLAHFFSGIYFEKGDSASQGLVLRDGVDGGLEKSISFMGTLLFGANSWSSFWRRRHYTRMKESFPDRPVIVSEGDSWFQHPLLDDIIDNIGQEYPVYCLAAAGDTIRNYYDSGDVIKAVQEVKPALLLLSGGGNDILGDNMPNYLQAFTDGTEGEHAERFFNEAFEAELADIMGLYQKLFDHFKAERPDMPILVHSYDFPRPRAANAGKWRNWLGQYFDQYNISRPNDRASAVHYMINEFNRRLKDLVAQYSGQVYHIDERAMVSDGQWDDEIHPDNNGFRNVSAKFLEKIKELLH